jgi:porphobilinogen synthase
VIRGGLSVRFFPMALDFPIRPRRLRASEAVRALVREHALLPSDFIYPLFFHDEPSPVEVASMPGVMRHGLPTLLRECEAAAEAGIRAVALFPCMDAGLKDAQGSAALNPEGLLPRVIRAVKGALPGLLVVTDVALDPFTEHGHDGVLSGDGADVLNDETVEILCRLALIEAEAGADFVAPSDMMDGRVGAIRKALDHAGFERTGILAYSAKFASAYYGPFREAVGSKVGGDSISKATYQLDPANAREALREVALDEAEGADVVMVKPAGPYLDIIRAVKERAGVPVAAYQVSGEYAQIHAAARAGWLDYRRARDESLLSIRRAGADMILSYFAREFCEEIGR